MRELTLFYAPNINSYKRYVPGSFAPTAVKWGVDNRTCSLRLVGHGPSLRIENRVPGGDVNPYLAVAALIAAGLHGIDAELPLEEAFDGQRLRLRRRDRAAHAAGRAGAVRGLEAGARRPSATTWWRTTPTTPGSSWPPSTRRSPTGSCSGDSNGCERMKIINPATEDVLADVEMADAAEVDRAVERARTGLRRPGGTSPRATGPGCCARFARPGGRARARSWPCWRSPTPATRSATPAGRRATSATCCTSTPGRPSATTACRSRCPAGVDVTFQEPLGVVGVIVPWNFPMLDHDLGRRPGARGGQHGDRQARRVDPADRAAAGRAGPGGGPARGGAPGAARGRGGRGRPAGRAPGRGEDRVHRLDRGRQADRGQGRRPRSSGSPSSSAARAPTSSSPTPTWRRRRRPRPMPSSTTPARTAAPAPASWCERSVYDEFLERLSRGGARTSRSATPSTRAPRWAR